MHATQRRKHRAGLGAAFLGLPTPATHTHVNRLTGTIRTRVTPGVMSLRMMMPAFSLTNTAGMPGSGWSRGLLMMMSAS